MDPLNIEITKVDKADPAWDFWVDRVLVTQCSTRRAAENLRGWLQGLVETLTRPLTQHEEVEVATILTRLQLDEAPASAPARLGRVSAATRERLDNIRRARELRLAQERDICQTCDDAHADRAAPPPCDPKCPARPKKGGRR